MIYSIIKQWFYGIVVAIYCGILVWCFSQNIEIPYLNEITIGLGTVLLLSRFYSLYNLIQFKAPEEQLFEVDLSSNKEMLLLLFIGLFNLLIHVANIIDNKNVVIISLVGLTIWGVIEFVIRTYVQKDRIIFTNTEMIKLSGTVEIFNINDIEYIEQRKNKIIVKIDGKPSIHLAHTIFPKEKEKEFLELAAIEGFKVEGVTSLKSPSEI